MKSTRRTIVFTLFVILLAAALVPFETVHADLGPKSSMHFEFAYEIDPPPTIVSGSQLECHTADCADAEPLGQMGAQGFGCTSQKCSSVAYGYAEYHRLSIEFSDGKTRQSNVFGKNYFEAYYRVTVREGDLLVEELAGKRRPPNPIEMMYGLGVVCLYLPIETAVLVIGILLAVRIPDIRKSPALYILGWIVSLVAILPLFTNSNVIKGFLVTLTVEMGIMLGYILWRKRPLVYLLTLALLMNVLTWIPFRMIIAILTEPHNMAVPVFLEFVIWLVEGGILAAALRKDAKFWEALVLSLVLNLASFGIGLLMPF